jgi:monoamine oxidase
LKIYIKVKGDIGNIATVAMGNPLDYVMTYKQAIDYTLLVAFGKDPAALDVYDDEDVQRALDAHLPGVEVLSTMSYDWNNDPYAKGTWAVYRPGWVNKYYDQFQKDYGRIFFGSSDHGEGWRGFIDGAIGGGIKAAQRVKEFLG